MQASQGRPQPAPEKKWYTKAGMIILIIFLGFIGVTILFFTAFFGYYLWVSKYVDSATQLALREQFREQFTLAPELRGIAANDTVDRPVQSLVQKNNPRFGNPNATVTIVAFIDFECPFSRRAYPIFKNIMNKYEPAVQVVFKNFPIDSIHPRARKAALAAQCAREQGAFWKYYDLLFTKQDLSENALTNYARSLRLNMQQFSQCVSSNKYEALIEQDFRDGIEIGVRGTPSYVINQKKIEGNVPADVWDSIIVESLQQ